MFSTVGVLHPHTYTLFTLVIRNTHLLTSDSCWGTLSLDSSHALVTLVTSLEGGSTLGFIIGEVMDRVPFCSQGNRELFSTRGAKSTRGL